MCALPPPEVPETERRFRWAAILEDLERLDAEISGVQRRYFSRGHGSWTPRVLECTLGVLILRFPLRYDTVVAALTSVRRMRSDPDLQLPVNPQAAVRAARMAAIACALRPAAVQFAADPSGTELAPEPGLSGTSGPPTLFAGENLQRELEYCLVHLGHAA